MAQTANPFLDIAAPATTPDIAIEPRSAVARLAQMHAEAVETARLANLLGRTLHAAIALPVMAVLALLIGGGAGVSSTVCWAIFIALASLAIARTYAHAIRQPFERAALLSFAEDLSACLLYSGFAWGSGAFLAIAVGAPAGVALLFAGVPALTLALLLRERQAVLLFLAPVAGLTAFACVLRPFAGGALAAASVLIACAIVAGILIVVSRQFARRYETDMPQGLLAS